MKIFSINGPIYRFLSRFWDVLALNFMWFVFSLPVITIGASTVAAHSVALHIAEEHEGYIVREFVKAFKTNFRQGTFLGLIALGAAFLVYINIQLFNGLESQPVFPLMAAIFAGTYLTMSFIYVCPLVARYQTSLIKAFRNSFEISMKYLFRTLLLVALLAFIVFLILFNGTTLFFGLLMGPAFIILAISSFALKIFKKIEQEQEQEQEQEKEK